MKLPLQDIITVPNQSVSPARSAQIPLPPLPGKPGKIVVLRFRIVCQATTASGCNYHAALRLNDTPVRRFSAGGEERMVGREPTFTLKDHTGEFHAFSGQALLTMFAPDTKTGDAMTGDELGATYALDISDIARGVDGNTLSVQNTLQQPLAPGMGSLVMENIEIGWLDRTALPKPAELVPQRGPIADIRSDGALTLAVGKAGGFAVKTAGGLELVVETALGMQAAAPPALAAEDILPAQPALVGPPTIEQWGPNGYKVTAAWPAVKLTRTLGIENGLIVWKEEWQNTGEKTIGVPFRHRIFLNGEAARFWLAGSPENTALAASSQNPTAFLESRQSAGNGFGVTAESDWLRLLMWLRARAGVGELYSETLALAPGSTINFELSIAPVTDGGGYWSFINGMRERWGLNGLLMKRPVFWGYERAPGQTPEEVIKNSLGHLGPITLALSPWQRLEPDARTVQAGQYPKLPPQAPRTPGKCPDLDIEAFLTFKHRDVYEQPYAKEVAAIHRALPQAKVIQLSHPSMEAVYKPLLDRWPMAAEAIRTREGAPFEDAGYSRAWVGDMAEKDWGVLYFVPRPGSRYLEEILRNMRRSMDEYGSDGIYSDEFGWGYTRREYSRYDYSRWDGYSADLDSEGNVARLKSDNAHTAESAQAQVIREVHSRDKFFLANGAASLRSITSLPYARFVEGGNGHPWMSNAHLNPTPLILGNMGDEKTRSGVFESVKSCLSVGCVYSPTAVNLLLEGPDNFVSKLYPLTVRSIRPGTVLGDERLITSVSGSFEWPGRAAQVRLYRYDASGKLLDKDRMAQTAAGRPFEAEVPEKGLVVVEVVSDSEKPSGNLKRSVPESKEAVTLSPSERTGVQNAMTPEAACRVARQGDMVELESPSFAYRINLSESLKPDSWENRLTGRSLSLGGHPEIEVDLDASDRRLFITGWRIALLSAAPRNPDQEEGFLKGFAAPVFDDSSWQGKPTPVSSNHYRVSLRSDYVWVRTHLFLPPDTEGKPLTLVLGGVGLYDFRYMRVFVNGQEAGVRETAKRWNEPGAFDIGPGSAVYKHLRFGQDNIIALQLSGLVTRTERLDELDPKQNRSLTVRYYWPGQFEQYLVVGRSHVSPRFHVTGTEMIREGDSGEWAAHLKSDLPSLSARVTYRWEAGEPLLHRFVEIQNDGSSDIRVMNVGLGRYETGTAVSEGEQGIPVYIESQFFAALAHPAGWAIGQDGEARLRQYPGKVLRPGEKLACMEAVLGVAKEGGARQAFLEQMRGRMLRLREGHNRPYAIFDSFGSWPDGGFWTCTEEFLLKQIETVVGPEQQAGCAYDFSTIELWRDRQGDIERPDPKRFPNGFGSVRDALDRLGIGLGLWTCTSLANWSIDQNPVVGDNFTHDRAYGGDAEWFCMTADPFRTMFYTAFRDHIRKNNLGLIKLDGTSAICYNTTHSHWPGIYSTEAIDSAFIEILQKLHRDNPALLIMLYWGLHSPWWLEYADTLFEPGLQIEASHPSSSPALYVRDSVTVGLDQAQWWAEDIPPLGKDSLGVWLSDWPWNSSIGKERWQEGFVMDICRGSLLAQPWSDNGCLTQSERLQLADFIALLKERPDCFGNPRFIIGNPWKEEPYGYSCSSGERAFLAINNCSWTDRTFELKLDPSWGLPEKGRWDIYRWYPNPARLIGAKSFFENKAPVTLRAHEVALLEVVPAGTKPSLKRDFPRQEKLAPFAEPSRAIAVSVSESGDRLPVPMEEGVSEADLKNLPPGRSMTVRGQVPPSARGGIVALTLEMRQGETAASIHNVGNCFAARARQDGREIAPEPIIPRWTFPAPWQGWRIRVGPSEQAREIELRVSARLDADIRTDWKGYFIPSDM